MIDFDAVEMMRGSVRHTLQWASAVAAAKCAGGEL
jgi:hypothetical protein